jgi:hypothetical protein
MKKVYPIILVSFLGSLVFLLYVPRACFGVHDIYPFYSEQLRTPLFTGFLTLGAFLLSLQTFILIRLKEGLYDNPEYRKLVKERQANKSTDSLFGPLTRLGNLLIYSVLFALITAFYQFSIGLIRSELGAAVGLALAFTAAVVVLFAWWQIRGNLNCWFENLERDAQNRNH